MKYRAVQKFYRHKRYQKTGKEYFTIVQMIVKDDREKAIAWRSVSRKMTCYHVSDEKTVKIISLRFVPSLQFTVCSLQSAVYILLLVSILYPVCSLHFVLTVFPPLPSPSPTAKVSSWSCE